jgi:hypothetical protein
MSVVIAHLQLVRMHPFQRAVPDDDRVLAVRAHHAHPLAIVECGQLATSLPIRR